MRPKIPRTCFLSGVEQAYSAYRSAVSEGGMRRILWMPGLLPTRLRLGVANERGRPIHSVAYFDMLVTWFISLVEMVVIKGGMR